MTDQAPAYAQAVDQLRARAEAAEKDRDMYLRLSNDETEAKVAFRGERDAALARAEAAEKERDLSLDYLYSLGRYYGRPRQADETVGSWAGRVTKAIHANQEPSEVSVQLRDELDQLQVVNARLKAEGLAAIERAKTAERQHVDAAARADTAEKERDALRAQIQTGDYLLRPAPPTISEVMLQGALQRAEAAEKELAGLRPEWAKACDRIGELSHTVRVVATARDTLRTSLEAVTAERDQAIIARDDADANMRDWRRAYDGVCAKLTDAKCRIADLEAAAKPRAITPDERYGADKWLPELNRAEGERTEAQSRADAAENALRELKEKLDAVTADRDDMAQKFAHGWIEREVDARLMAELQESPVAHERNQLREETVKLRSEVETLDALCKLHLKHSTEHATQADRLKREVATMRAVMHAAIDALSKETP